MYLFAIKFQGWEYWSCCSYWFCWWYHHYCDVILSVCNNDCIIATRDRIESILNKYLNLKGSIQRELVCPLDRPIFCNSWNFVFIAYRDDNIENGFEGGRAASAKGYLGEWLSLLCWVSPYRPHGRKWSSWIVKLCQICWGIWSICSDKKIYERFRSSYKSLFIAS